MRESGNRLVRDRALREASRLSVAAPRMKTESWGTVTFTPRFGTRVNLEVNDFTSGLALDSQEVPFPNSVNTRDLPWVAPGTSSTD